MDNLPRYVKPSVIRKDGKVTYYWVPWARYPLPRKFCCRALGYDLTKAKQKADRLNSAFDRWRSQRIRKQLGIAKNGFLSNRT